VAFIQLQRHGDRLHGTLTGVEFDATPYAAGRLMKMKPRAIYGTISGSKVVLHFSRRVAFTGTISRFVLLIRSAQHIPAGSPPLAPERYRRATVADYLAVAARKTAEAIRMQKKSGTG
jgi:hypothetical protein